MLTYKNIFMQSVMVNARKVACLSFIGYCAQWVGFTLSRA